MPFQPDIRGQLGLDMSAVDILACSVQDEQQACRPTLPCRPREHEVVEDAPSFRGELGVALAAMLEAKDIGRAKRLEGAGNRLVVRPGE